MSAIWDERADAYRESEAHREGDDLDLLVEWAAGARTALDVGTGGGHLARRLRDAGLEVVSADPAPRMRPDVVCQAEELPFADRSFDVVATRLAAHHFGDVTAAAAEMARVARRRVLVVDNLYVDEASEEADRVRDPSHVRNLTEHEWRAAFEGAGLAVAAVRVREKQLGFAAWLARAGCEGENAARVRELVAGRLEGDTLRLPRIALEGVRA